MVAEEGFLTSGGMPGKKRRYHEGIKTEIIMGISRDPMLPALERIAKRNEGKFDDGVLSEMSDRYFQTAKDEYFRFAKEKGLPPSAQAARMFMDAHIEKTFSKFEGEGGDARFKKEYMLAAGMSHMAAVAHTNGALRTFQALAGPDERQTFYATAKDAVAASKRHEAALVSGLRDAAQDVWKRSEDFAPLLRKQMVEQGVRDFCAAAGISAKELAQQMMDLEELRSAGLTALERISPDEAKSMRISMTREIEPFRDAVEYVRTQEAEGRISMSEKRLGMK